MLKLKFEGSENNETHILDSYREGEWIVFYCVKCPGYEKRYNPHSRKLQTKGSIVGISHRGYDFPNEHFSDFMNINYN